MTTSNDGSDPFNLLGQFLASCLRKAGFDLSGGGGGARLLTMKEACAYLGMGETKFRQLETERVLPERVLVANLPRWDRRDLDKYVERIKRSAGGRG